tara:strand:- start:308 stop:964 length:657 start_codon:yes stop_codon:yes gene_type:complete
MYNLIKYILYKNSPCRSLQNIESKKFKISGICLEIGNTGLNKKSFFNFFKIDKKAKKFFTDMKKKKSKNYFNLNLENRNNIKIKFDNIIIFNVLEHVYEIDKAIKEIKKLLKPNGKIFISTPFLYRYHMAPKDYHRPTLDFYSKLSKKNNLKIIYQKNLGTGPFLASYSIMHNVLKKIFPVNIIILIIFLFVDKLSHLFSKNIRSVYPVCNFVVLRKK